MGNGTQTRFGHDIWSEDRFLKETFSELFCIARDKESLRADHIIAQNDRVHWDMNFFKLVIGSWIQNPRFSMFC